MVFFSTLNNFKFNFKISVDFNKCMAYSSKCKEHQIHLKGLTIMTNVEIITNASAVVGIEYDGSNLKTFAEWKKAGFNIIKGQKAVLSVELWKPFNKKVKDETTGEEKTEKRFMLKKSHLFHRSQVEAISNETTVEIEELVSVETVEEVAELIEVETAVTENEIKKAWFTRKPSDVKEVLAREYADYDRYKVVEEMEMSISEFADITSDLFSSRPYLAGKGGTSSTVELDVPEETQWHELTEEQREAFRSGAYREVIRISCKEAGEGVKALLIDSQGYDYPRYVAVEQ